LAEQIKMRKCPECGEMKPEANFVKATAVTRTDLEYKKIICSDCYFPEDIKQSKTL